MSLHPTPTAGLLLTGSTWKVWQGLCARACPDQVENVNRPEGANPMSPGPGTPGCCPLAMSCGDCRPHAPTRGPWAATPELGHKQSQAQVLAAMEAVSQQVRPLQMPHPQKFRAASRRAREAPHLHCSQSPRLQQRPKSRLECWSQPGAGCGAARASAQGPWWQVRAASTVTGPPLDSGGQQRGQQELPIVLSLWGEAAEGRILPMDAQ